MNSEKDQRLYEWLWDQVKWKVWKVVMDFERLIGREPEKNPKVFFRYTNSKVKTKIGFSEQLVQEQLVRPLQIVFLKSLDEGYLPKSWQEEHVTLIFKKEEKTKANNYRPVSLACVMYKVLESLIRNKIMDHMFKNELFSPFQYGFFGDKSCITQLISVRWLDKDIEDGGNY